NVVRDGCPGTCNVTITVNPNPTCSIAPTAPVCTGTSATYTSTVSPAGGTVVTHAWTITGNGTIVGSTTGSSVVALAGAAGTFTLTDNVVRDGCPGTCNVTITVNPNPTCAITPTTPVCTGTSPTYTSTVSPAGGTVVTHAWTIT